MKIRELDTLLKVVLANPSNADLDVVIVRDDPSVGTKANTPVKSITVGFDWERGKLLIFPTEGLHRHNDEEQIKELRRKLDDLAYENSGLKRENHRLKNAAADRGT